MRKGIMSLTPLGRRTVRRKTANMEVAEQASAKQEEPANQAEPVVKREKPFVQTVLIPKTRTALQKKSRRGGKKPQECGQKGEIGQNRLRLIT